MRVQSRSFVLGGVTWGEYRRIARSFSRRRVRITYDRGALEIMSPTLMHESDGELLNALILAWHEERRMPIKPAGSTTFRSRRLRRAIEPDKCYYLAHELTVRGLRRIDLNIHPPPDLAVEVDVTRRSIRRLPIYRALGVPEVWRLVRGRLLCRVLQNGRYVPVTDSQQIPGLRPADLEPYLAASATEPLIDMLARFRLWCHAQP